MTEMERRASTLVQPRKRFSRDEIRCKLTERITKKEPILAVDAGIGLVAKMAAASDIDLITASSEGRFRMMGQPSCMSYLAVGNANDLALDALKRACRMSRQTPVLCALAPGDPYREPEQLLAQVRALGADGIVIGLPGGNGFGERLDRDVDASVLSSAADLYLLELCGAAGAFTMAVSYDRENAVSSARCGADVIVAHAGFTVGGLSGPPVDAARTLDEVCAFTEEIVQAVHAVNPKTFVLCHGATLNTPEAVQECLTRSGAQGLFGGSVFDRLPIEESIREVVSKLESLKLNATGRP